MWSAKMMFAKNSEIHFEEVACKVKNSNVKCFIVQLMLSNI